MAKNSVADWDETASNNTDIGGIDIDEGCAPSGINNAIRTVMSQLRAFFKANVFRIRDNTDQTKLLAFDVSGVTTGTTRTLTVPDASGSISLTYSGAVIQSAIDTYTANVDLTAAVPFDDTIPDTGEGTQVCSVTITPKYSTSKLRVTAVVQGATSLPGRLCAFVAVGTGSASRSSYEYVDTSSGSRSFSMVYTSAELGSVAARTVSLRVGPDDISGAVARLNGHAAARYFGGTIATVLTVEEIAP